jgi:hypothetical protein
VRTGFARGATAHKRTIARPQQWLLEKPSNVAAAAAPDAPTTFLRANQWASHSQPGGTIIVSA